MLYTLFQVVSLQILSAHSAYGGYIHNICDLRLTAELILLYSKYMSLRSDWLGDKLRLLTYCRVALSSTKFGLAETLP